jgi:hypothetical protein
MAVTAAVQGAPLDLGENVERLSWAGRCAPHLMADRGLRLIADRIHRRRLVRFHGSCSTAGNRIMCSEVAAR